MIDSVTKANRTRAHAGFVYGRIEHGPFDGEGLA